MCVCVCVCVCMCMCVYYVSVCVSMYMDGCTNIIKYILRRIVCMYTFILHVNVLSFIFQYRRPTWCVPHWSEDTS